MLFTSHRYHNHIIVLICIVFILSMLIYIQPRSRIHVMVTRSSYATLYLSEWPGHTTPGHIISYTNLPLSICCEYSKEPSLCDCSLEYPEYMHTPLSYHCHRPEAFHQILFSIFSIAPAQDNGRLADENLFLIGGYFR